MEALRTLVMKAAAALQLEGKQEKYQTGDESTSGAGEGAGYVPPDDDCWVEASPDGRLGLRIQAERRLLWASNTPHAHSSVLGAAQQQPSRSDVSEFDIGVGYMGQIKAAAWSPCGKWLCLGSANGAAHLMRVSCSWPHEREPAITVGASQPASQPSS
jgi:hypothetical protein